MQAVWVANTVTNHATTAARRAGRECSGAPYIWIGTALFTVPSFVLWRHTPALIAFMLTGTGAPSASTCSTVMPLPIKPTIVRTVTRMP